MVEGGFLLDSEHVGVLEQLPSSLPWSPHNVCLRTRVAALGPHGGLRAFLHGSQGLAESERQFILGAK